MTEDKKLSDEVVKYIDQSVLCWLATSSADQIPNVSPKEIFMVDHEGHFIIANIASPNSVKNIRHNPNVCVSFIDILVQKGYQLKGTADIIDVSSTDFKSLEKLLIQLTKGKFPFSSIIKIKVNQIKPIIAPRYLLYPETTEQQQIESAKEAYGL